MDTDKRTQAANRAHFSMPAYSSRTPVVSVCICVHLRFHSDFQVRNFRWLSEALPEMLFEMRDPLKL